MKHLCTPVDLPGRAGTPQPEKPRSKNRHSHRQKNKERGSFLGFTWTPPALAHLFRLLGVGIPKVVHSDKEEEVFLQLSQPLPTEMFNSESRS